MKSKLFTKKMFIPVILVLALLMGASVVARQTVVKERLDEMAYREEYEPERYPDGLYLIGFKPDENKNKIGYISFFHGKYYHLQNSEIPCYYEDIVITGVTESAYLGCKGLEKVTLPQTIEYIENNAFTDCKDLKEIYIPASVTSISETAFKGTTGFKMYVEKNSTAEKFAKENNIEFDYYTPEPIKKDTSDYSKMIYDFENESKYYNIYYYEGTPYGAYVRHNASTDVYHDTVPKEIKGVPIKNIVDGAFSFTFRIKSIKLPETITTVGSQAFSDCKKLKKVYFTENVTSIGSDIFKNSKKAIICAPKDSYAHKYAIENNIPFEEIK